MAMSEGSGFRAQGSGSPALPFRFVADPAAFRDEVALVVRVPTGVRSKQKLLRILAGKLRFPGYFGWNWDALEECLRDLSWLREQRVAIVHDEAPFGAGGENRRVYLAILASVAEANRVQAVFAEKDRESVESSSQE
jgi:hypothetical protein